MQTDQSCQSGNCFNTSLLEECDRMLQLIELLQLNSDDYKQHATVVMNNKTHRGGARQARHAHEERHREVETAATVSELLRFRK